MLVVNIKIENYECELVHLNLRMLNSELALEKSEPVQFCRSDYRKVCMSLAAVMLLNAAIIFVDNFRLQYNSNCVFGD